METVCGSTAQAGDAVLMLAEAKHTSQSRSHPHHVHCRTVTAVTPSCMQAGLCAGVSRPERSAAGELQQQQRALQVQESELQQRHQQLQALRQSLRQLEVAA